MQFDLFADEALPSIPGLIYQADFLTPEEEKGLLEIIATLPLMPARYKEYESKVRILSFGGLNDFNTHTVKPSPALDARLVPLRNRVADWINDRQYAYSIINANQLSGDKGPYVLAQKLSQKGIAKSTIEEVLKDFDFSEIAQRVAEKLLKKYNGKLPARALQDKIIQNLTNKGFSYSDAKSAFDNLDSQVDQETTQELIFKELDKQYTKYASKYEGYELKQRLTQVLARKGYDFSDIASALREYL